MTNIKENIKEIENTKEIEEIEKAFEGVTAVLNVSKNFNANKNRFYDEACFYALKIVKMKRLYTPLKKLLIDLRLSFLKPYFEELGFFLKYNAKDDFLKVFIDEESPFFKSNVEDLITYSQYVKDKKESTPKKEIDYNKRLSTLFKDKNKKEIENVFKAFLNTLKN